MSTAVSILFQACLEALEVEFHPIFCFAGAEKSRIQDIVVLNVGGTIHQVRWDTIDKFPNSRLQRLRYATSEGEYEIA